MMDHDVRLVFDRYMSKAKKLEEANNYVSAKEVYIDAYEIAKYFEDSAQQEAYDGVLRCRLELTKEDDLTR